MKRKRTNGKEKERKNRLNMKRKEIIENENEN